MDFDKGQKFIVEQFVKHLVDGFPPHLDGLKIHYELNSKYFTGINYFKDDEFLLEIPAKNKLPFVNELYFDRLF